MSSNKRVGNYELTGKLGSGSYAQVFTGRHMISNLVYAVKAISKEKVGDPKLQDNLDSEISIMRDYQHPNIVRLFEHFNSSRFIYLVLELCNGGDLSKYIKKFKKIEEHVAQCFLRQLSDGLHFLSQKNLIHRDLKPANVLLTECSENAVLKLADFGFAKHLTEASMAQTPCGTPLYMAPEIFEMQEYDAKADLWSVGCIFYEMLVGTPPFKGSNPRELFNNIKTRPLLVPPEIQLSTESLVILQRLLERNPARRVSLEQFYEACRFLPMLRSEEQPLQSDLPNRSGKAVHSSTATTMASMQGMPISPAQRPSSRGDSEGASSIERQDGRAGAARGRTTSMGSTDAVAEAAERQGYRRGRTLSSDGDFSSGSLFPPPRHPALVSAAASDTYGSGGPTLRERPESVPLTANMKESNNSDDDFVMVESASHPWKAGDKGPEKEARKADACDVLLPLSQKSVWISEVVSAIVVVADGLVLDHLKYDSSWQQQQQGRSSAVTTSSSSSVYRDVQYHASALLCGGLRLYLHGLRLLREAMASLQPLGKADQDQSNMSALSRLKQGMLVLFDQVLSRAEQAQARLTASPLQCLMDDSPAAEHIMHSIAGQLWQEAAAEELLGNLAGSIDHFSTALLLLEGVMLTAADSTDKRSLSTSAAALKAQLAAARHRTALLTV